MRVRPLSIVERGLAVPTVSLRALLDGYLAQIVEREFAELGHTVRRPAMLRAWLTAYAAATATTTSYNRILDAATPGEDEKPAKTTTIAYREVLEHLYPLEPLPASAPASSALARLAQAPKHHLADPALAAHLLGADRTALLAGDEMRAPTLRHGDVTGRLIHGSLHVDGRSALELRGY